jgi:peroxiredoxin Q/BCP
LSPSRVSPAKSKSSTKKVSSAPTRPRVAASQAGIKEPRAAAKGPTLDAPAPSFTLPSDSGEPVSLSDYRGRWVVLFFYPKDNTPGCTREAIAFQEASARLARQGAVVLGVSRDSITLHTGFKQKHGLKFPLLSDPAADTHKLYGAFGEKVMYGKKVIGAIRTTALIRPDGTLAKLYSPVKVDGHADAVLEELGRAGGSR